MDSGRTIASVALLLLLASLPAAVWAQPKLPEEIKLTDAVASGGKRMSGTEIQKMVSGNTVYYVFLTPLFGLPRGGVAPAFYRDARTRVQLWKGKPVERLWWMEGDAMCWEAPEGPPACSVLVDLNGTIFSCNRDQNFCRAIIRTMSGNQERL